MPSGDGLIVRIRPPGGALTMEQADALAGLARSLGNGHIDLTRRANLQLRGLGEERLPELHHRLAQLSLLDGDPSIEARRNIMVSPLAGLHPTEPFDVRPIAIALDDALVSDRSLQALPAKFGFLVDGGGALSISGERADIGLAAIGETMAFGLDTPSGMAWLGSVAPDDAVAVGLAAARAFVTLAGTGRMRDHASRVAPVVQPLLHTLEAKPTAGARRLGLLAAAVGIAAPFGRLEATQLHQLVGLAKQAGAADLRLSPWRSLYIGVHDIALVEGACSAGLIVDEHEPLLRIEACPGAPACASSTVDTRGDARRLANLASMRAYRGRIHVSGCAKKCACSGKVDLTLVGEAGRYRTGRRLVDAADLDSLFDVLAHG
jgi:precorrin-3B synthase